MEKDATDVARVEKAYRLTLGRTPGRREVERARAFLAGYESASREQAGEGARTAAWLALAQALYASAEFRYLK